MGIFQQFPYSNFHEMNLDQIIKIMRQMQDEWEANKTEWASYKEFIDNYFENLDVSQEVLDALRIFAADGTLATIMDPTIATETAAWLAEHITQPTTPAIDTSLSVAGAAADAKAAGDAIIDLQNELDRSNAAISEEINAPILYTKWIKGSMTAAGVIVSGDNAISDVLTNVDRVTLGNGCYAIIFVYNGATCLGKFNANCNIDNVGGSGGTYFNFAGAIDIQALLLKAGHPEYGIRLMVVPTDGTVITDDTVDSYGQSKVHFSAKSQIDINKENIEYMQSDLLAYPATEARWICSLFAATDAAYVAGNGAMTNILHNVKSVTLSDNAKSLLLLYKGNTYLGKLNVSYVLDKIAGSWGYFTKQIDVEYYTNLYSADGIKLCVVPTDNTGLTQNNVGTWAEANVAIVSADTVIKSNLYKENLYSEWVQGAFTRDGVLDPTVPTLITSSGYLPKGYDTLKMPSDVVGVLFAFDENDAYYGATYNEYTLSNGFYTGTFFFANEFDLRYLEKAFPDVSFRLCVKYTNGSNITPADGITVQLSKNIADLTDDVNSKISGIEPIGCFGYARDNFIISIGHRGGEENYPENTEPAFIQAARDGLLYVETDIAYTSDGVPVLLHDRTINRTARNADGTALSSDVYIADITYAQALTYDFGIYKGAQFAGTKIMTFEEFIILCKNLSLTPFIELKRESVFDPDIHTQARVDNLISIVKKYSMQHHVTWGSFDQVSIGRVLKTDKNATVALAISSSEVNDSKALDMKIGALKAFKKGSNFVYATIGISYATEDIYTLLAQNEIACVEWYINNNADALNMMNHPTTFGGMTDNALDIGKAIRDSILE